MTNQTDKDLLLIAEKLGSALDRIEKIETDFAVQAAPIQAAGASQDAALKALEAALCGIKALNQHVLQNDLGLLSTKLDESGKQFEKALVAIDEKVASNAATLAAKLGQVRAELAAATATRIELSAAREDAATKVQSLASEFTRQLAQVRSELAAKAAEFSEPKGMEPAGEWESGKSFDRLAVVSLNGSSYISKTHANFEKPDARSKAWQMLARRGGSGGVSSFDALSGVVLPQQLVPGAVTYDVGDILYAGTTGALSKLSAGTSGKLLSTQGAGAAPIWVSATGGAGDINGPASATDNAIVRFDGTGGKTVQNSPVTIADTTGAIAGASSLTAPAATDLTLAGGTAGTSAVKVSNTTASTSTTTGAFQSAGGLGVAGAAYIGGQASFQSSSPQIAIGVGSAAAAQIGMIYVSGGQYFGLAGNRNPATGIFANTAGTHASIDLDTGAGGSAITFRTTATPNTLGTIALTIGSNQAATFSGDVALSTAGKTLSVKSGTNALAGTVTLASGAGTITSSAIDVNTVIVMSIKTLSGSFEHAPSVRVSAGSATIDGHNSDNSTYNWVALKVS